LQSLLSEFVQETWRRGNQPTKAIKYPELSQKINFAKPSLVKPACQTVKQSQFAKPSVKIIRLLKYLQSIWYKTCQNLKSAV